MLMSTSFLSFDGYRPKRTEQNLIVCVGKSEAKVTNNKRLRSRYCTVEATIVRCSEGVPRKHDK